jgi:hypothetical protein
MGALSEHKLRAVVAELVRRLDTRTEREALGADK